MALKGESAGSTNTLYSVVRRAMGVRCVMDTGGLPVMMPPSMTAPMTISAFGSPLLALKNCARPIAPAAPPWFSKLTELATPASCKALPSARPVLSQPTPRLAGIIIFILALAQAMRGKAPAAAIAARDLRHVSRRMVPPVAVGSAYGRAGRCHSAVVSTGANPESRR
jgi:hypothetical protein